MQGPLLKEHILSGEEFLILIAKKEAHLIIRIAKENPLINIRAGIRVNSDIGANYISRFGIEPGGDSFDRIVSLISNAKNIKLSGVHCHISRQGD